MTCIIHRIKKKFNPKIPKNKVCVERTYPPNLAFYWTRYIRAFAYNEVRLHSFFLHSCITDIKKWKIKILGVLDIFLLLLCIFIITFQVIKVTSIGHCENNNITGSLIFGGMNGGYYSGDLKNCSREGYGKIVFANDSVGVSYEGEWKNNLRSGNGTMIWRSKEKYIGHWEHDNMFGTGRYYWPNGQNYFGKFENSQKHGFGEMNYPEHSDIMSYKGNWKNNVKSGTGKMTWRNNETYIGNWLNDSMVGSGIYLWPNGQNYSGEFKNGLKDNIYINNYW